MGGHTPIHPGAYLGCCDHNGGGSCRTFGSSRSVWGLDDRTASWVRLGSVGVEAVGLETSEVSVGTGLVEGQPGGGSITVVRR